MPFAEEIFLIHIENNFCIVYVTTTNFTELIISILSIRPHISWLKELDEDIRNTTSEKTGPILL